MVRFDATPEQAGRGRVFADADLPRLPAEWLVEGYDSPLLRELAGLSRADATEARRLFGAVLAELGHPLVQVDAAWDELPWRGYWSEIEWAVDQLDRTHAPYAAAQRVLNVLDDVPDLWHPGHGAVLQNLLDAWLQRPEERDRLDDELRAHLLSLSEQDVPPLNVQVHVSREAPEDRAGLRGSSRDDGELTGSDQDRPGQ